MHTANMTGCRAEVDEVWKLDWPNTAQGRTASIPCGPDKIGNHHTYTTFTCIFHTYNSGDATRKCSSGAIWAAANVLLCENAQIAIIRKMVKKIYNKIILNLCVQSYHIVLIQFYIHIDYNTTAPWSRRMIYFLKTTYSQNRLL